MLNDGVQSFEIGARRGQAALVHHADADDVGIRRDADVPAGDDRRDAGAVRGGDELALLPLRQLELPMCTEPAASNPAMTREPRVPSNSR